MKTGYFGNENLEEFLMVRDSIYFNEIELDFDF